MLDVVLRDALRPQRRAAWAQGRDIAEPEEPFTGARGEHPESAWSEYKAPRRTDPRLEEPRGKPIEHGVILKVIASNDAARTSTWCAAGRS